MKYSRDREICQRIAQLRVEVAGPRGKSSFAKQLGLSPSTYDYYESTRVPPADVLVRIAEIAQVDLNWLLSGVSSKDLVLVPPHPVVTRAAELLRRCPNAAAPLAAFLDILAGAMEFPRDQANRLEAFDSQDSRPAREGWIPILGRSAAGVPQFWSDTDSQAGLTTLAELAARHAAAAQDVRPARVQEHDAPESDVQLVTLRECEEGGPVEFVVAPHLQGRYPDAFAVRIDGNSMTPEIQHADVVLLSPSEAAVDGRAAVVQLHGQIGVTCKLYRREGEMVHLAAINETIGPQSFHDDKVDWALRVLARVRP